MARVSRRKQIAAAQGLPVDELPKAAALRIFRTALYVRLSIMDTRDRKDSESLQTQIDYLCGYIAKHPDLELYDCYRDNGETGTNFERPGFQRMMEDVKAGRVDCIIVKDLSRFGRDFLETGNFLEKVLPFMGVRFISVNDNYDSIRADSGEAMTIALKNLMNDIYAKDISQKVYSALDTKKRSGEFIGNFAAYGYVKSPEDRHKLAVDPDAAKVVQRYGEVLRNAFPAAITLFAQYCASVFGTSALIETVFSIQGLGYYLTEACESMDVYGISGVVLICAISFVLFNTVADIFSGIICPAYRRKRV